MSEGDASGTDGLIIAGIMAGYYLFLPALGVWTILAIAGKGLEGRRGDTIRTLERIARWFLFAVMLSAFLAFSACMFTPGKP